MVIRTHSDHTFRLGLADYMYFGHGGVSCDWFVSHHISVGYSVAFGANQQSKAFGHQSTFEFIASMPVHFYTPQRVERKVGFLVALEPFGFFGHVGNGIGLSVSPGMYIRASKHFFINLYVIRGEIRHLFDRLHNDDRRYQISGITSFGISLNFPVNGKNFRDNALVPNPNKRVY